MSNFPASASNSEWITPDVDHSGQDVIRAVDGILYLDHDSSGGSDLGHKPAEGQADPPELSPEGNTVSLVIPARNEAKNVAHILPQVPECVDEVILVDGNSSDVTTVIAKDYRPDIRIINEPQRGKGYALRSGFNASRGDIVVAMDADGSMSPDEIPELLYFLEHDFDFVKGSRFIAGGGSLDITKLRRLGNRALLGVANVLFHEHLTDLCYGFFAIRRKYLDRLNLQSSGFEIETELTIRALRAGLRVAEVPSLELPRRTGRSNLRSLRDGQRVLKTMLEEWYREKEHVRDVETDPEATNFQHEAADPESGPTWPPHRPEAR